MIDCIYNYAIQYYSYRKKNGMTDGGCLMTVVHGRFEWDSEKNQANVEKHGIDFKEILDVFDDPYFFEIIDSKHSTNEDRFFGLGSLNGLLILLSCYTERNNHTRIISVRRADKELEEVYHDNIKKLIT